MVGWAHRQLRRVVKRFYKASPKKSDDLEALHRFRVRGKELRYAMELLSTVFPHEFRSSLYPRVTLLQDKLGDLNDHATAHNHLAKWCNETDSQRVAKQLRKLMSQESKDLEKSILLFRQWWTPEYARDLEAAFDEMIDGWEKNARP